MTTFLKPSLRLLPVISPTRMRFEGRVLQRIIPVTGSYEIKRRNLEAVSMFPLSIKKPPQYVTALVVVP